MGLYETVSGFVLLGAGSAVALLIGWACWSSVVTRRRARARQSHGLEPRWWPDEPPLSTSPPDLESWDEGLLRQGEAEAEDPRQSLAQMVEAIRARPIERIGRLRLRSVTTSLFFAISQAEASMATMSEGPDPDAAGELASANRLLDDLIREERRRLRRDATG